VRQIVSQRILFKTRPQAIFSHFSRKFGIFVPFFAFFELFWQFLPVFKHFLALFRVFWQFWHGFFSSTFFLANRFFIV